MFCLRASVSLCSFHRSESASGTYCRLLPGKMKQSFQLPCICNLGCFLGCISCSIYVWSSTEPLCVYSDLRLPRKENQFVKEAENRINRKKTSRQSKSNVQFSKFSEKEQIQRYTACLANIYKNSAETSLNLFVAPVSQLLNRNKSLLEVGSSVIVGDFLVLISGKLLKVV